MVKRLVFCMLVAITKKLYACSKTYYVTTRIAFPTPASELVFVFGLWTTK